jgi:hypothetical protein
LVGENNARTRLFSALGFVFTLSHIILRALHYSEYGICERHGLLSSSSRSHLTAENARLQLLYPGCFRVNRYAASAFGAYVGPRYPRSRRAPIAMWKILGQCRQFGEGRRAKSICHPSPQQCRWPVLPFPHHPIFPAR